jgi:predicted nucleotidyltransferase
LTKLRTSTEAYVDRLKRRFHFPSCLSITNQDKLGTTVRRENTRSHSDLDIYVEYR